MLIWLDDKNFLILDLAAEGAVVAPFVWAERFEDGKAVSQKLSRLSGDGDTWLRIVRKEDKLTLSFSDDGDKWTEAHTEDVKLPEKLKVGVLAINTTTTEFVPTLEAFKLQNK